MSYIGSTPVTQSFIAGTDYFNGNGSTTAFTLSRSVVSTNDIQATVNNVVQQPNDAYTVSGTTITFTSAPSAGTNNVYVRYLSTTTQSITPSQNTVSYSTLNSDNQSKLGISFKNRLINPAMVIDQRNAGASVTPTTNATYTLDRWRAILSATSKFSVQQNAGSVTPPAGFVNYLGITSTSAYSIPSGQLFGIAQTIEGYNTADLNWGSANAKTVTISFWVRSSLTGTFGGTLYNDNGDRFYPFSYTINAVNTWEQKSITITGDLTGTWSTTNGVGVQILFTIAAGSTLQGTPGAWGSTAYYAPTGQTSVVGTNGATFYITGVQLEVGTQATTFDYRSYGTELQLCQRYFQKIGGSASGYQYSPMVVGWNDASNTFIGQIYLPVTMRSAPTLGTTGTANDYQYRGASPTTASLASAPTSSDMATFGGRIDASFSGGTLTGGYGGSIRTQTNAGFLSFSAEL
jgi:hypothetical protein